MDKPIFQIARVSGQPVTVAELLDDLRQVAVLLAISGVSRPQYKKHGKYGATTIHYRFGSWSKALLEAGLTLVHEIDIPDNRLFENLLILWQHYGRQPVRNELAHQPSNISQGPYNRRFGSWSAALKEFVKYANGNGIESPSTDIETARRTTGRDPSLRLRWYVLQRDNFTCCACGASPALTLGAILHVDHIIPWSKGGATVLENLQTLCSICNLGKSNVHSG